MTKIDLNAICAVVYGFFLALDRNDNQSVSVLMAKEGVWRRQGTELLGPGEVLAALEKRDSRRRTAHTVSNLWVEFSTPEAVRVRYYLIAYETRPDGDGKEGEPRMLGVRECSDDLVLEGGSWRVQRKESHRFLPSE